MYDIIVIGGGASGLAAAISACRETPNLSVAILERNNRVGKKLLTTGNGRCNISNLDIAPRSFHSANPEIVAKVINGTDQLIKDFFADLGVLFIAEGNQLYPYSLQAATVLDALRYECERLNVSIICDCKVDSISKGFAINTTKGVFKAKKVIVACGGNAMQSSGSDGNGLKLLSDLGIKSSKTYPAIVPIRTELAPIKALKGVKVDGIVTLSDGLKSVKNRGEVLFTEYGMSGPAVMFISRFVNETKRDVVASVDLLPDLSFEYIVEYLMQRKEKAYNYIAENLTLGLLHKRVGQAIIKYCGLNVNDDPRNYSYEQVCKLASAIKDFTVKVTSTSNFESAQTTAGGVYLTQVNCETFETNQIHGLYLCGEVLDCDGDCGGFNLHWAWVSGIKSGQSAAKENFTQFKRFPG